MRGQNNPGGINILDVDDPTFKSLLDEAKDLGFSGKEALNKANELFWEKYNLPFLEDAFKRGDDIRLLSDPTTLFSNTGFYQRELEVITQGWKTPDGNFISPLMKKYGYKYNTKTNTYEKI